MRKIIIILSSCIALLLLGYTSYRGYQVWRQNHGISMAKGYLAKDEVRNATLALRQVLLTNPRNIEASRMMAGAIEAQHSPATLPSAVQWRQHVLEIDPESTDDRLALAQTAILNKDYLLASNALAGIDETGKKTATYHNIAGMAAIIGNKPVEAEAHFSEAIRLDPANPAPQMNLAVVRLHLTNQLDMAEARIALQRIIAGSTNASLRVQARRELIDDATHFRDFPTALNLSKELVEETNSLFTDKLVRLGVLMMSTNAEFKPTLYSYQTEAGANPAETADLAAWQMTRLPLTNTLSWLRQVPMQTRTNQLVEILAATCLLHLGDWRGLQAAIQQQNWNDPANRLNQEFLRHAFMARSLRGQGLTEAANAEWTVAMKAVNDQKYVDAPKYALRQLFSFAMEWGWATEAEQILWTVVGQYPDEKWAYPVLRNELVYGRRTQSLLQLFEIMHKQTPDDLALNNNLAATALLLGDQKSKPYDLAQEVYSKAPTNPVCASTYAFALYRQGKYADALKVMQQLNPKDLNASSIALYYGLILKANGNKVEAKAYLDRVSKAELWPEEQALYDQAKAGL